MRMNNKSKRDKDDNGMNKIDGFFYDVEKKRYFPISMKSDPVCDNKNELMMNKEVLLKKVSLVKLLLTRKYRIDNIIWNELNEYLEWNSRVWTSVELSGGVKCMNMNSKWLYLGYHGCVLRYGVKERRVSCLCESVYSCVGGDEIIDVNGDCILVNIERGVRVVDLNRGCEVLLRGEYVCVNRYIYEGRECIIIGGERICIWSEEGVNELKTKSKCVSVNVNVNEVLLGFRNGCLMSFDMNRLKMKEIMNLRSCIVSVGLNMNVLSVCNMRGECVLYERMNDKDWMNMNMNIDMKVDRLVCMSDSLICICKDIGYILNMRGDVMNRIEGLKYVSVLNDLCVLINEDNVMKWSNNGMR